MKGPIKTYKTHKGIDKESGGQRIRRIVEEIDDAKYKGKRSSAKKALNQK